MATRLFDEAKKLGYKGSFGHMASYFANVRSLARANATPARAQRTIRQSPLGPASGSRESWLTDAKTCSISAVVNFAGTLMMDIQAVRNAVIEPLSNGQTGGQINPLKTLKRAMYRPASVALLCVRMRPASRN